MMDYPLGAISYEDAEGLAFLRRMMHKHAQSGPDWTLHVVRTVMEALQHKDASMMPHRQLYGCWALAKLAAQPELVDAIVSLDGHLVILGLLHATSQTNPDLMVHACKALAYLAPSLRHEPSANYREDAVQAVLETLRAHPQHDRVQQYGMMALVALATHGAAEKAWLHSNTWLAVAKKVLNTSPDDGREAKPFALMLLATLCSRPEHAQAVAAEETLLPSVLATMAANMEAENFQKYGCKLLAVLGERHPAAVWAHRTAAQRVIAAMTTHPRCEPIQQYGCLALMCLAVQPAGRSDILAACGTSVAAKLLLTFCHNNVVAKTACNIFRHLPLEKSFLANSDVIRSVILAMKTHPEDAEVQHYGCAALKLVAANNTEKCNEIVSKDGIDVILSALLNHSKSRDVVVQGCTVLLELFSNLADIDFLLHHAKFLDIFNMITSCEKLSRRQGLGCLRIIFAALEHIAKDDFVAAIGFGQLVHLLELFPEIQGLQSIGCQWLYFLARRRFSTYPLFLQCHPVLPVIMNARQLYPNDEHIGFVFHELLPSLMGKPWHFM
jgi:hypothetical protein